MMTEVTASAQKLSDAHIGWTFTTTTDVVENLPCLAEAVVKYVHMLSYACISVSVCATEERQGFDSGCLCFGHDCIVIITWADVGAGDKLGTL